VKVGLKRQIKLSLFIAGAGHHIASWRHPSAISDGSINFEYIRDITLTAEKGKFDFVFFADGVFIDKFSHPNIFAMFEPMTLLASLSQITNNIGLAATVSTTYNEPFNIARQFASLDILSKGRSAWNIVTTADPDSSKNFGFKEHMEHDMRYHKAEEFVKVVIDLMKMWEYWAFVVVKKNGVYLNTDKIHLLNFKGDFFSVQGPLNIPTSPQGHPVLIQAGTSGSGQKFAAKYAEVIFTNQINIKNAISFYNSIKEKAVLFGRFADDIIIMPGFSIVLGLTNKEAYDKYHTLNSLISPLLGIRKMSKMLGKDLSEFPLNKKLPEFNMHKEEESSKGYYTYLKQISDSNNFTLGQLSNYISGRNGHYLFVGTPENLANVMQEWFEQRAADAFNVMPLLLSDDIYLFVERVIPILQSKGLFRKEYENTLLRGNLGLVVPPSK